jgi:CrcB protein
MMTTWFNLFAVALGGAVGSVARYLIELGTSAIPGGSSMLGTVIVNVLGCAALGAFAQYSLADGMVSERMRLAIQVGFLGGLTTFSTLAGESSALASDDRLPLASLYVGANLVLGWVALMVAAGIVKGSME